MQIAEKFTSNDLKFSLYWTDLNSENLSVDNSGKVKVIDLENIIVVDVMAIEAGKKPLIFLNETGCVCLTENVVT